MSWEKIFKKKNFDWNKKSKELLLHDEITPYQLFKVIFNIKYKNFLIFSKYLKNTLKIKDQSSVMDFGSGNGSLLLILINNFKLSKIYSYEINKFFINFQKRIISKKIHYKLTNNESFKIPLKNSCVDVVYSNSVLQYLPNKIYTKNLILELIRISKERVVIMDIHNVHYINEFKKYQKKKYKLTDEEYKNKYA